MKPRRKGKRIVGPKIVITRRGRTRWQWLSPEGPAKMLPLVRRRRFAWYSRGRAPLSERQRDKIRNFETWLHGQDEDWHDAVRFGGFMAERRKRQRRSADTVFRISNPVSRGPK